MAQSDATDTRPAVRLSRRLSDGRIVGGSYETIFPGWKGVGERWLFISPHDDDVVMGAGLLLQRAVPDGIRIHVAVTTDGSMGYCSEEDRPRIVEIRAAETTKSFSMLGIDGVEWLGFPDQDLTSYAGRRRAAKGERAIIEGFTGLQNAYTSLIRRNRPTRLFLCSQSDYHPDHKMVYEQAVISVFHAAGDIWPELGPPIAEYPCIHELAVYCNFSSDPDIRISAGTNELEKKLKAIAAYESQKQIARAVDEVRANGPVEYLRTLTFQLYQPSRYEALFGGSGEDGSR